MNAQIVSFHCVVKDKMGRVISSTFNQDILTYDGTQPEILSGLVRGLQDLKKGEKRKIEVRANEAYGFYDLRNVIHCSREALAGNSKVKLGDKVRIASDETQSLYRVTEIYGDEITLDANHPLAGQDLVFEIEATEARMATADEVRSAKTPEVSTKLH